MRRTNLRAEVGLPVTIGPGALKSPHPGRLLRKNLPPARPSPLSLKALMRPQHSFAQKCNKLTLPSISTDPTSLAGDSAAASATPATAPQPTLRTHSTIEEQFEILGRLEAAIFGSVVKARRRLDDKLVAIKVLDKDHMRRRVSMKDIPVFENAQVEMTVLQKSADCPHPNVLRSVHGSAGEIAHDSKHIYSITPFCDGGELYDAVQAARGLPADRARNMFTQIVRGVHHLHTRLGYVHNDISPENVLLRSMQRVVGGQESEQLETIPVLTDFGLAAEIGQPAPRVPGKVCYQAPEVLYANGDSTMDSTVSSGHPLVADAASDVFSLGVLLFVMLTGVLPYNRPNKSDPKYAALQEGPASFGAAAVQWDVPACTKLVTQHPKLLRLICDMTRHRPEERPTLLVVLATLGVSADFPVEVSDAVDTLMSSRAQNPWSSRSLVAVAAAPAVVVPKLAKEPLRGRIRRQQRRSTGHSAVLQHVAARVVPSHRPGSRSIGVPTTFATDDDLLLANDTLPFTLSSDSKSADEDELESLGASGGGSASSNSGGDSGWLHLLVDGSPQRARGRCAFEPSSTPAPTLDLIGTSSPLGVADLAFQQRQLAQWQEVIDAENENDEAGFGFNTAAARARLNSSCSTASNTSSGSNNKRQHAQEERHVRQRRRNRSPSRKRRHSTKVKTSPMAGLLHQVLQQGLQLDKFRSGAD